jgi:glyoxylase-like metal-dependent hydrolase (beta-lactamase superfamily II)
MTRPLKPSFLLALLVLPLRLLAAPAGFEMVKIADGVYGAIRSEALPRMVDSNAYVIINDQDVVVVDANLYPSSARAVLAEIRKLTDKPVRYVINTHWHDDHVFGAMVYQEAFPQVEVIGHANTRTDIVNRAAENLKNKQQFYTGAVPDIEKQLAAGKNKEGQPLSDKDRKNLTELRDIFKASAADLKDAHLVPSTITYDKAMTLYRGKREIKLMYLGRGNTRGDTVVWLPQEKVLITGDLLVNPIPFAFGSYFSEWIADLKKLKTLDAQVIVTGHGPVEKDWTYLDSVIDLLQATLDQAKDAVKKGLSLEEARKVITLDDYRAKFAGGDPVKDHAFTEYYLTPAVERAYKEAKGELEPVE